LIPESAWRPMFFKSWIPAFAGMTAKVLRRSAAPAHPDFPECHFIRVFPFNSSLKNELLGDAGMRRTRIKHASV
jgi:hypothetical protein